MEVLSLRIDQIRVSHSYCMDWERSNAERHGESSKPC